MNGLLVLQLPMHAQYAETLPVQTLMPDPCLAGGCCSVYPFEVALAIMEVEGDVVAGASQAMDVMGGPEGSPGGLGGNEGANSMDGVTRRYVHKFPWELSAGVHLALCMRRRAYGTAAPSAAAAAAAVAATGGQVGGAAAGAEGVTHLGTQPSAGSWASRLLQASARRRRQIKVIRGGIRSHLWGWQEDAWAQRWVACQQRDTKTRHGDIEYAAAQPAAHAHVAPNCTSL